MKWLAALALCACGTTGTIDLELATAPGSTLLDSVQRLRVTITNPRKVVEAQRRGAGFDLALEVDAGTSAGALIVEGFDAAGALVACGQSPRFPIAAINATVVVYMAAPRSIAEAPVGLPLALSDVAASRLSFGAVVAGGRDSQGFPSRAIALYNAFDHTLLDGLLLPQARARVALATGDFGEVYLFGGSGPGGDPAATLWLFDPSVAPNGRYLEVSDETGFARSGQLLLPTGDGRFLITGTPVLAFDSITGLLNPRTDVAELPAVGASALLPDGSRASIFVGAQLLWLRGGAFSNVGTGRSNATAAALPGGRLVVIGGGDPPSRDALVIDGTTGVVSMIPDALAVGRLRPLVAATPRHLVVAGGTDIAGVPLETTEVLDATTLAPLAMLPSLVHDGGFAIALPNDQVLLGGGTPASTVLELFTPEPPAL